MKYDNIFNTISSAQYIKKKYKRKCIKKTQLIYFDY
jgi:hypothetical protein